MTRLSDTALDPLRLMPMTPAEIADLVARARAASTSRSMLAAELVLNRGARESIAAWRYGITVESVRRALVKLRARRAG